MRYADDYAITGRSRRKVLDLRKPHHRVPAAASGFPWNLCDFGYERVDADHFTINGGEIQIGDDVIVAAGGATVTITTDASFVGWEYNIAANSLTVKNFGTTVAHTPAYVRKWLYRFSLDGDGFAAIDRYGIFNPTYPKLL